MSQAIPEELRNSAGMQYVVSKGWDWEGPSSGQVKIKECPICHKGDYKFFMSVCDPKDGTRDGLYMCFHGSCGATGNLIKLKEALGDRIQGVQSRSEWAGKKETPDELPNVELCHATLLSDADAMDYLVNVRGFTEEVIRSQKLGLKEKQWFKSAGDRRALVYPYLVNGNIVYAKYRTLPPDLKDFSSPSGWEAPLYNGEILQEGIKEVIFVEGEANTVSMLSHGIVNVVGVPGANVKKAAWIETIDNLASLEKIYIFYDNDKVGNKAAQEIASRIGIDRCLKLTLPAFEVNVPVEECKACDDSGKTLSGTNCLHRRQGKDFNEWCQNGGTIETFEELKVKAKLFDVTGVISSGNALDDLEEELSGKEDLAPTYVTQYLDLNRLIGFEDGDILDIVAPGKVGKTTFGLNLMDHMVATYGEDGLIVCLEMTQKRLARKWVSIVTGFEETQERPGSDEAKAKLSELKEAVIKARGVQQARSADLYFAYPQLVKEPEDVFKLIRDCVRRYGVKWVMFDNLQRLCDDTLKHQGHRTIHLSQISKGFAKLAKDYKIKLIRIVQPKQIDQHEIISSRSVDGSSQIEKDCDAQILLWRKSLNNLKASQHDAEQASGEDGNEIFDPEMKVTVSLSRYSSGGWCWLMFDGARSTVRSKENKKEKPNFNAILAAGGIPTEGEAVPVSVQTEVTI
jgi:replicative DNA helicase